MSLKQSVTPFGVRNSKVLDTRPIVTDTSSSANHRPGHSAVHALLERSSGALMLFRLDLLEHLTCLLTLSSRFLRCLWKRSPAKLPGSIFQPLAVVACFLAPRSLGNSVGRAFPSRRRRRRVHDPHLLGVPGECVCEPAIAVLPSCDCVPVLDRFTNARSIVRRT